MIKLNKKINIFKVSAKHDWWIDTLAGKRICGNIKLENKEIARTKSINIKSN